MSKMWCKVLLKSKAEMHALFCTFCIFFTVQWVIKWKSSNQDKMDMSPWSFIWYVNKLYRLITWKHNVYVPYSNLKKLVFWVTLNFKMKNKFAAIVSSMSLSKWGRWKKNVMVYIIFIRLCNYFPYIFHIHEVS